VVGAASIATICRSVTAGGTTVGSRTIRYGAPGATLAGATARITGGAGAHLPY
jgi:hypothetical protein